jgi:uncharacterized protein (TIGR01777 family)
VGRRLVEVLIDQAALVAVVSRNPDRATLPKGATAFHWKELPALLEGADAVFNFAGEGIADQRWSPERKEAIFSSRIESTRSIVAALHWVSQQPSVLVNASAIGFYGAHGSAPVDEEASPGKGFLAETCQAWEQEAEAVTAKGVRLVKMRLGVVLAKEGGALPKMARPVRLFLGCNLGSGSQGFSWIHLEDLVQLLLEAALNPKYEGIVNATSPAPVSQKDFTRSLARQLHRPVWPLPAFLTRSAATWFLGEMAESMLLQGAFVQPGKALRLGFQFRFGELEAALADLVQG